MFHVEKADFGSLTGVIEKAAYFSQTTFDSAALIFLSSVATAVSQITRVQTLGSAAPCSLSCLLLAESGERKSPLLKMAYAPHEAIIEQREKDFYDLTLQYESLEKYAKRQFEKWAKEDDEIKDLTVSPIGVIKNLIYPDYCLGLGSVEAMFKSAAVGLPALCFKSPEASQFFAHPQMQNYNAIKPCATLNALWSGEEYDNNTMAHGSYKIKNRCSTLCLVVQPSLFYPVVSNQLLVDQGFFARFLIYKMPSLSGKRKTTVGSIYDTDEFIKFSSTISSIVDKAYGYKDNRISTPFFKAEFKEQVILGFDAETPNLGASSLPILKLSPESLALFQAFDQEKESLVLNGFLKNNVQMANKLPEQAIRIAACLQIYDDVNSVAVDREHALLGIKAAKFYANQWLLLSNKHSGDALPNTTYAFKDWLRSRDNLPFKAFTKRHALMYYKKLKSKELDDVLKIMVDEGDLEIVYNEPLKQGNNEIKKTAKFYRMLF